MDALLVFDANDYLIHSIHNAEFLNEIARMAISSGQLPFETRKEARQYLQANESELRNLIVLLLGPFVASLKILQSDCPKIDLFGSKSANLRIFYYEVG